MATKCNLPVEPENGKELCRVKDREGLRGFRKDILTEKLTKRDCMFLTCSRCEGILREACISGTGEQFCLCCSKKGEKTYSNLQVRNTVSDLKSLCPIHERGCKWEGNLGECEKHLEVCGYVYEMCKLGCGLIFTRDELNIHSKEMCSHRIILCEHCNAGFKYYDLPRHHSRCRKMPVRCMIGCDELVISENMTQHIATECEENEINCLFLQYGCRVGLIKRKEMNQHLEDNKFEHMVMRVNSLEETVVKQKETIMQLVRNNEHMVMKVNSLEEIISLLTPMVDNLLEGAIYDNVLWKVEGITDILERNKSLTSKEFILHDFPMTFTLIASTNHITIRFQIVPGRQNPTFPVRTLTGYFITSLLCIDDDSRLTLKSKQYHIGEPTGMLLKMVLYTEGEITTINQYGIMTKVIKEDGMNFRIAFKRYI